MSDRTWIGPRVTLCVKAIYRMAVDRTIVVEGQLCEVLATCRLSSWQAAGVFKRLLLEVSGCDSQDEAFEDWRRVAEATAAKSNGTHLAGLLSLSLRQLDEESRQAL